MYRVLLVCLVGLAVGNNGADIPRKIMEYINTWNRFERCFGEINLLDFSLELQQATEYCKALPPGQRDPAIPANTRPFFPRNRERFPQTKIQDDNAEILKGLIQLLSRNKRQAEEEVPKTEGEVENTVDVIEETEDTVEENEDSMEETKDEVEEGEDTAEETEDDVLEDEDDAEEIDDEVEEGEDAAEETEDDVLEDEDDAEEIDDEVQEGEDAAEKNEDDGSGEFDKAADTGLLKPDESDIMEFVENLEDWKTGLSLKISNLTCVLTQLGFLDTDGRPDLGRIDSHITSHPGSAVADPEFRQMMTNSYSDCQAIADSWPQEALDRNRFTKDHGRNIIFFRCVKKAQVGNCGKWDVYKALEVWYGKPSEEDRAKMDQIGLPANKFDAAVITMKILYNVATPEEEFINDFFWGKH